ncbi:MAG: hypothetical protein KDJ16_14725, partial [Hyphomicrobiales bacterium]|nr:hypothetical protein [Hyphomicrobiales bacterium]
MPILAVVGTGFKGNGAMRAIFSAILIATGLALAGPVAASEDQAIAITPTIGHDTAASAVAFSPDGRFAATGAGDNAVKLWDVATGRLIRTFAGHSRAVNAVVFSPDGTTVASGGGDG